MITYCQPNGDIGSKTKMLSPRILYKNRCCEIGCPAVLVRHNALYTSQQTRTTWVALGLSLFINS